MDKYMVLCPDKPYQLPIKSILKNGNKTCQTFPGETLTKYHEDPNALTPHPGCRVSVPSCSVSCGLSTHSGHGVSTHTCSLSCGLSSSSSCVSSLPGASCCVRERKRTLSALGSRPSARSQRACSPPCSGPAGHGEAGPLTPRALPRTATAAEAGVTGHSKVKFHPVIERFRYHGDTEYCNLAVSSTPGHIYHPERTERTLWKKQKSLQTK